VLVCVRCEALDGISRGGLEMIVEADAIEPIEGLNALLGGGC
jgi:hypothetical protein